MTRAALQWLPLTATEASTERMGSIGTFLASARRALISPLKLATRMGLRFLKDHMLAFLQKKAYALGVLSRPREEPEAKRAK